MRGVWIYEIPRAGISIKPCRKCGGIVRYASNTRCIVCFAKYKTKREEEVARKLKEGARYDGSPCAVCGGTLRYTCNGTCVECRKKKDRLRKYKKETGLSPAEQRVADALKTMRLAK